MAASRRRRRLQPPASSGGERSAALLPMLLRLQWHHSPQQLLLRPRQRRRGSDGFPSATRQTARTISSCMASDQRAAGGHWRCSALLGGTPTRAVSASGR